MIRICEIRRIYTVGNIAAKRFTEMYVTYVSFCFSIKLLSDANKNWKKKELSDKRRPFEVLLKRRDKNRGTRGEQYAIPLITARCRRRFACARLRI